MWKIACIQTDIVFGSPEQNMQNIRVKVKEAVTKLTPDIIVLPELWNTAYDLIRLDDISDEDGIESKRFLSELAKQYHVKIVGGSVARRSTKGVYNTMFIFEENGEFVGEYSKLHLFKLMDEHLFLQPGESDGLFELDSELCAGMICYDIRFPEWIRSHTLKGAKVLFVSAQWPLARLHHWRTLLLARAIENQCYVVACNRVGSDPNNVFAGHSMIIDPWGEILSEGTEEEGIIYSSIDLRKVDEVRAQIPIFEDRKPTHY
ncbi:carbon-nitrogen family hydrolase [Bacillus sp. FJAT-45066]|uniref:carbon-nitrogen family hydrolase n=1 Tax=Bacillus sp. FJAT-45066 TaxID=2011010 RepID=UPI000BB7640C|nr:carbon-nitrogen family hydrolase [Bacillus sp. FJAT-45066]